jgi:hypothetical protein
LVEKSELPWGNTPLCVTVSAVGTLGVRGDKTESMVARAEKLLREKKAGPSGS